jgi:hypothetical protein
MKATDSSAPANRHDDVNLEKKQAPCAEQDEWNYESIHFRVIGVAAPPAVTPRLGHRTALLS